MAQGAAASDVWLDAQANWEELHARPEEVSERAHRLVTSLQGDDRAWGHLLIATREQHYGDPRVARVHLRHAHEAARQSGSGRLRWLLAAAQGMQDALEGDAALALRGARQLEATCSEQAMPEDLLQSLYVQYAASLRLQDMDAAFTALYAALDCAERFRQRPERAWLFLKLAEHAIDAEDWHYAGECLRESELALRALGNDWLVSRLIAQQALLAAALAPADQALGAVLQAMSADARQPQALQHRLALAAADLQTRRGDFESAQQTLVGARTLVPIDQPRTYQIQRVHESRLQLAMGRFAEAARGLEEALAALPDEDLRADRRLCRLAMDAAQARAGEDAYAKAYAHAVTHGALVEGYQQRCAGLRLRMQRARFEVARRRAEQDQAFAMQLQIQQLALRDPISGLYTRRHLVQNLPALLSRCSRTQTPVAIVALRFTDAGGAEFVEGAIETRLINALAIALESQLRAYDFGCRYDDDTVLVVLEHCDASQARARLTQLSERALPMLDGTAVQLTLGVADTRGSGYEAQTLIDAALGGALQSAAP
ncbi:MAG TPA: diguanylate cyclase [Burkholderiaceae bacterium]|nr:diguanylate cyclase [Burkholderiaceae bacterium]